MGEEERDSVKPHDFDWVTARHKCSLAGVFRVLAEIVDTNVQTANALIEPGAFERNVAANKVIVIRKHGGAASSVVFTLEANAISVKRVNQAGNEKAVFTAKPALTTDGECVLEINDRPLQPLELWQVCRLALEDFFFGE